MAAICPITDKPLPPGRFVHATAINDYRTRLRLLPGLTTDLLIEHTRQALHSPRIGAPSTGEKPVPYKEATVRPTARLKRTVLAWAHQLWVTAEQEDPAHAGLFPTTWDGIAWWLWHTANWLATQPDAPTAITDITNAIDRAATICDASTTHRIDLIGSACIQPDNNGLMCGGRLYAIVHDDDSYLPPAIHCERHPDHEVPPSQWSWLGRTIRTITQEPAA